MRFLIYTTLNLVAGENEKTITMDQFAEGVYMLRVSTADGIKTIRIIKE